MSYLELYQIWLAEDLEENEGCGTIFAEHILNYLVVQKIINKDEENFVRLSSKTFDKNQKLFCEIMPRKGLNGLKALIHWFKINEHNNEEKLKIIAKKIIGNIDLRVDHKRVTDLEFIQLIQSNLKNIHLYNCESINNYWKKHLKPVDSENTFAPTKLENLTAYIKHNGMPVENYVPLFEDDNRFRRFKRILIEGDAGCGKTTFVNKLTLDWVNEHEYLRWRFDLVFHFYLPLLKVSVKKSIQSFVPHEYRAKLKHHLENVTNRILFVFDGFDELPENHVSYGMVLSILNKNRYANVTVVITSRRSHIDRLPQSAIDNCSVIKGFDNTAIENYFSHHNPPDLQYHQQSGDVKCLMHIPLFASLFCSLPQCRRGIRPTVSLYDVVDNFVDNVILETKRDTVGGIKKNRDTMKLGKRALSKLYFLWYQEFAYGTGETELLKGVMETCELENDDRADGTAGLLTKFKVPTGIYGKFVEEDFFPHQLLAECLAARFLLNSLDLQNTHPEKLFEAHRFDIPIVQFLLNGILTNFINGKLDSEQIRHYLEMPNLYMFWYSKVQDEKLFTQLHNIKTIEFKFAEEIGKNYSFFNSISKCSNLEKLILPSCRMSSECLHLLINAMTSAEFKQLNCLDFRNNFDIGKEQAFFEALKFCTTLKHLNFSYCDITYQSVQSLVTSFEMNCFPKLNILHLQGNSEIGKATGLFEILKCHENLRKLDIGDCTLTDDSFRSLTTPSYNAEKYFPMLEELELDFNEVVGRESKLLLKLDKCPNLKVLLLFGCNIHSNERLALEKGFQHVHLKNIW